MVNHNGEVETLRQENRFMRQEINQLKNSPRLAIGYGAQEGVESPNKTISDAAFSIGTSQPRPPIDRKGTEPTPANRGAQESMSPQGGGGGFFMT